MGAIGRSCSASPPQHRTSTSTLAAVLVHSEQYLVRAEVQLVLDEVHVVWRAQRVRSPRAAIETAGDAGTTVPDATAAQHSSARREKDEGEEEGEREEEHAHSRRAAKGRCIALTLPQASAQTAHRTCTMAWWW